MKEIFLILFMLCACIESKAEIHLVVWSKDGKKVAFELSEKPKITFGENFMNIESNAISVNYILNNMAKFTYESGEEAGIRNIETDKISSFSFDGELLLFPILETGSTVSIFSLNGTMVFTRTIKVPGGYSFPISNLDKGVYLVSVNGLTYKIMKR